MSGYLKQTTILYVEDDKDVRDAYKRTLRRFFKEVFIACNGAEGLELYKRYRPDIVMSDIKMPKKNGIEMAKEIKEIDPEQCILFTTAHTESDFTLEALELQVDGYIAKPVDKKSLIVKLTSLAKNIVNEKENIKKTRILQAILNNQSNITILTDFNAIELASNSFFELMKVKNRDEFLNNYQNILEIFRKKEGSLYAKTKEEFLKKYKNAKADKRIVSISNKTFYINIDPIDMDVDTLYAVYLTDITLLQQKNIKARYEATHDFLTKLYNRAKFSEIFKIEFMRSQRYQRPLSVAILDIDHFKNINDTYGHLTGDKILKELADYCKTNIRKTDFIARWGGEEFIIVMSETDKDKSKEMCEILRKSVEKKEFSDSLHITISIGVSQLNTNDSEKSLIERADIALYKAKNSGRNKVVTE